MSLTESKVASNVSRSKSLAYIALSVALMAICAWLTIPGAVPFTMQTFAVFLVLTLLGGKHGTMAIGSYLLLGLVGFPVFSSFRGGVGVLFGTTGGYLLGFLLAGAVYWLFTHCFGKTAPVQLIALLLGLCLTYLFGTLWFMVVYTGEGSMDFFKVLSLCVWPFLLPDLAKLVLAWMLSRRIAPQVHLD